MFSSMGPEADKLAVLDFYGHVLALYDDAELRETIKAWGGEVGAGGGGCGGWGGGGVGE